MTKTENNPGGERCGAGNRLFSLDFNSTLLANFANSFGMQILVATLPVYVVSLGGTRAETGLVSGALTLTSVFVRPFFGWLTDFWRRRPLILFGAGCYSLASVAYLLAGSIPTLLLGRFVQGVGLGSYNTATYAYVADIAPVNRRAEAVGLFTATYAFALVIGPVVGFMLIDATGFAHLFYVTAGLSFTALAISLFAKERRPSSKISHQPWSLRTGIMAVEALPIAWTMLCMGMGFGTLTTFISIFAQSRGVQNPGFYFMFQAIALVVSRTFSGYVADRHGRLVVIVPGMVLMAAALALLPWASGFATFVVSAFVYGIGFGSAQPATMALLIDRIRPERRGLSISTYFIGFDGGISVGAILLGVVSQYWGYGVLWTIAAICNLLGLAGLLKNPRRT